MLETDLTADTNKAAAAHAHFLSTPEKIECARESMICEGRTITEGAMLSWLLDSGESKDMCNDKNLFAELMLHCAVVKFDNGIRDRGCFRDTVVLSAGVGALKFCWRLLYQDFLFQSRMDVVEVQDAHFWKIGCIFRALGWGNARLILFFKIPQNKFVPTLRRSRCGV